MASGVNKAMLVGNLGKDPVIRTTGNGTPVASFSVATNQTWIDKATNEKRERREWHNVVVFGKGLVGIIEKNLRKGTKVYIEGSLHTKKWTDTSNIDRYTTEIVLKGYNCTLTILDNKRNIADSEDEGDDATIDSNLPLGSDDEEEDTPYSNEAIDETEDDNIPF